MSFASMEASWLEPDDYPELLEGCWDESQVDDVVKAVRDLDAEELYEGGKLENGIGSRFLARLNLLRVAVGELAGDHPVAIEAEVILGLRDGAA